MESRIPLKPVLGGMRIVELSTSSHDQSLLFSYIVGSLFLKDPFFQISYSSREDVKNVKS